MTNAPAKPDETPASNHAEFPWAACLRRVRTGDECAAREMVRQLYPLVVSRIRWHQPRRTSEEDLAQMIFIKLFTHLDQYSGNHPFEHWVSRIAVNTCLNQIKHEQSRPEIRWTDLTEAETRVLETLAAAEELAPSQDAPARELVDKLFQKLEPSDQLLMRLLYLEDKSMQEVQQLTGWGSVRIRVKAFRARRKMKACLTKLLNKGWV